MASYAELALGAGVSAPWWRHEYSSFIVPASIPDRIDSETPELRLFVCVSYRGKSFRMRISLDVFCLHRVRRAGCVFGRLTRA